MICHGASAAAKWRSERHPRGARRRAAEPWGSRPSCTAGFRAPPLAAPDCSWRDSYRGIGTSGALQKTRQPLAELGRTATVIGARRRSSPRSLGFRSLHRPPILSSPPRFPVSGFLFPVSGCRSAVAVQNRGRGAGERGPSRATARRRASRPGRTRRGRAHIVRRTPGSQRTPWRSSTGWWDGSMRHRSHHDCVDREPITPLDSRQHARRATISQYANAMEQMARARPFLNRRATRSPRGGKH